MSPAELESKSRNPGRRRIQVAVCPLDVCLAHLLIQLVQSMPQEEDQVQWRHWRRTGLLKLPQFGEYQLSFSEGMSMLRVMELAN